MDFEFKITKSDVIKRSVMDFQTGISRLIEAKNEDEIEGIYLEGLKRTLAFANLIGYKFEPMTRIRFLTFEIVNVRNFSNVDIYNMLFDVAGDIFNFIFLLEKETEEPETKLEKNTLNLYKMYHTYIQLYFLLGLVHLEIPMAKIEETINQIKF